MVKLNFQQPLLQPSVSSEIDMLIWCSRNNYYYYQCSQFCCLILLWKLWYTFFRILITVCSAEYKYFFWSPNLLPINPVKMCECMRIGASWVCVYVSDRVLQVLSTDIHSSFPLQRLRSIFIFTVWRSFWHASLLFTHSLHFSFSLFPPYPDICMFLSVFLLYIKRLLVSYSILFSIHSSSSYYPSLSAFLPFPPAFRLPSRSLALVWECYTSIIQS